MPTPLLELLASVGPDPNGVTMDAAGDLFGTTETGGANSDGAVFELVNTSSGYASTTITLASFNGTDGNRPAGPLLIDAAGDLFGTTGTGGANNDGSVFEIANTSSGYASVPTPLVSFTGANGLSPVGGVVADSAGDLFGVTESGSSGASVFEVVNTSSGYASAPTTLINFNGGDGSLPVGGLIVDSAGNLFGTTQEGGTIGDGVAFEIANTGSGYAGTPRTLLNFGGNNGKFPQSGLVEDATGDLFGITEAGGANGDGVVFEIAHTSTGYATTPNLLASFTSANGNYGNLIEDAAGDFFVTSNVGGVNGDGAVFEIADTGNGYVTSPVISFGGTNGSGPGANLTADAAGDLFATTQFGGGVYELTGSGFQAPPPASAPTVVSITAFPNTGDAITGTLVTLTATMSTAVTVTGGSPSLILNDGGTATFDAADSSGTALVFDYTVQAGQNTSALAVSGFNANGATIQDTLGDNASFVRPPTTFADLAVNFTILASFNFSSGIDGGPYGGLIADATGDLFGTTLQGGVGGDGTVFEIANTSSGYAGTPTTLVAFGGGDGDLPVGDLLADSAGDLFGTTVEGGANSDGTLFEIVNTSSGYASTPTTLINFDGPDGSQPYGRLIADTAGDLFGTTQQGGTEPDAAGTVFEVPFISGSYASTPTTLVTFSNSVGIEPQSGLITDSAGDLFGTTVEGGANSDGTLFEIVNTSSGYASTPTTLITFSSNAVGPVSGLVADAAGDLFGVTSSSSGGTNSGGSVFEVPFVGGHYASTPTILLTFNGQDGYGPGAQLIVDAAGNLFGTTISGGANNDGTVFEIANTSSGYASTATVLLSLNGTDGSLPFGGLLADSAGDLFGTTQSGGATGNGTVFELTDTVFQVACYRSGTRIATPAGERTIESLAKGDAVLLASGEVQPVVCVGQKRIDCRRHGTPENVWPVRVRAGAFGVGLPRRDLWLSPDHAVFVDDVLIPIKYLMNGTSIEQMAVAEITYCHIELPRHALVLAEGLPAESWLDSGDRSNFDASDDAIRLLPDLLAPSSNIAMEWEAKGCAPLIVAGAKLAGARGLVNSFAAEIARGVPVLV